MNPHITLKQLFIETFKLSAFTFGGGMVIVAFMRKRFVNELKWLTSEEMLDIVTIAQSAPGVLAVNVANVVGKKLRGFTGAFICILATIIPPLVIIAAISFIYETIIENHIISNLLAGMQVAVTAVVIMAAYSMYLDVVKSNKISNTVIAIVSFILSYFFGVSILILLLIAAIAAIVLETIKARKREQAL